MQYTTLTDGNATTVKMGGKFIFNDHKNFRSIIDAILEDKGTDRTLIIDLENIDFIDSAALGMLLLTKETAEGNNIKLILKNPKGQVQRTLTASKFDDLFEIEC